MENKTTFTELRSFFHIKTEDGYTLTGKEIIDPIIEFAELEQTAARDELPQTFFEDKHYKNWTAVLENKSINDFQLAAVFPQCTFKDIRNEPENSLIGTKWRNKETEEIGLIVYGEPSTWENGGTNTITLKLENNQEFDTKAFRLSLNWTLIENEPKNEMEPAIMPDKKYIKISVVNRAIESITVQDINQSWVNDLNELKETAERNKDNANLIDQALIFLTRSIPGDTFDVDAGSGNYGITLIHRENGKITGTIASNYNDEIDKTIQELLN